jgi:DNA mismatch repair protein MutS2
MELSNEVADISKLILMTYSVVSELDLIFAKSKFSLAFDCFRPVLNNNGYLNLEKARHPLIDKDKVVPSDIRIGKEFDTLVVTGPNTGGKTVVLKTAGLLTLMAQAGLHIPATEGSVVAVFDNIFADIGDEQSIEQSLSTFSSHMVNIVDILKNVSHNSLCLFDELGAGTDPVEGASLAVSILENVRTLGARTIATTHYSELKMYALTTDRVENASCEFNVETLQPTYKLLIGIPGKSNAFAISKKLGLDDSIIESAKNHLASENIKFEDVITSLEQTRTDLQKQKEKADAFKRDAQKLKEDTANTNRLLKDKTDKIIERARMEAKQILDDAKAQADDIIKEMRNLSKQANMAEAEKMRRQITEKSKKNSEKLLESMYKTDVSFKSPKTVKPGDDVEIVKLGQKGVVVSAPDDKGNIMVKVGIMKISSNLSDIRLVSEPKTKQKSTPGRSGGNTPSKTMSLSPELDVRGETVDTACILIDKFLDDAIMSSLGQVRIVHGKGTGQLRAGIHRYLRQLSYVKSFRLGVFGEGDSGVTVVEI